MPRRPTESEINGGVTATNFNRSMLNATIREVNELNNFNIPIANSDTTESIREIGNWFVSHKSHANAFVHMLINKVGMSIITSRLYLNPLRHFKKGIVELGESVEEIFVNITNPHQFDPVKSETEVLKRDLPDVRSIFHILNYQKFYKQTISNQELRAAFMTWDNLNNLIAKITESMSTSANYDEQLVTKYLFARMALDGKIHTVNIPTLTPTNMNSVVTKIKEMSNDITFLSSMYNYAGVHTATSKDNQFILMTSAFDAINDVEVLASAYNMDKAEFVGHRTLIDKFSFNKADTDRLALLFENDSNYKPFTATENAQLDSIACFSFDRDFLMIFDNLNEMGDINNPQGLYWNYVLHTWRTFSASPYSNCLLFTSTPIEITGLSINPDTATLSAGGKMLFTVEIESTGFANKGVTWELTGNNSQGTHCNDGFVRIASDETATSITVTATSVADSTKTATATITIA